MLLKNKIELIQSNFSVLLNGNLEVSITKLEFKTIELLSQLTGEALSYEEIYRMSGMVKTEISNTERQILSIICAENLLEKIQQKSISKQFIRKVTC